MNALLAKLTISGFLNDHDAERIRQITAKSRRVNADQDLIKEGDRPNDVHLVLEGFAYRYKLLPSGQRQILSFLLPGDFCDLHVAILGAMDHNIGTLTPSTIVDIPRQTIEDLIEHDPRITRALWWVTLVDEAVLREAIVNMGQRPAEQQLAHLFCELYVRLTAVGRLRGSSFNLPLTQEELGETLGLSTVHVNRCLQQLRADGLIDFRSQLLTVTDFKRLAGFCGFNPNYLHLIGRSIEHNARHNQFADFPSHRASSDNLASKI